jgi:hypothetical protein
MTLDTTLRTQLTSAVQDTTVPPGLARAALSGGRTRRRRRALGGVAAVAAAVVGGVLLLPDTGPSVRDVQPAEGRSELSRIGLKWASTLPQGDASAMPFFGEGGALWSGGEQLAVPEEVNRAYPPRTVEGGWLVLLGQDEERLSLAVLGADGELRDLPVGTFAEGFGDARVLVSADGSRAAYGRWSVDLTTMTATEVPHQPESDVRDGYGTAIRMVGWTEGGLVYEGAPFEQGFGTTWLLADDGTTTQVDPPAGSHISQGGPADVAVSFDYTDDESDTCVTMWTLEGTTWDEQGSGCMGQYLGEALAISPDGHYLLTDDLPRIWDLADGEWVDVEVPPAVVDSWGYETWLSRPVWEGRDTLLVPVADRWTGDISPEPAFDQRVQVVRCRMSTGDCERAGDAQVLRVESTMWGSTEMRFAGQ